MTVTIYDLATGEIMWTVDAPTGLAQQQAGSGQGWVVGSGDSATQHVYLGLIADRPAMPGTLDKTQIVVATAEQVAAGTADKATISNLPDECTVTVTFKGQQYEVMDGSFGFNSDIPGTFEVKVECWPYLDAEFTVEAVEA